MFCHCHFGDQNPEINSVGRLKIHTLSQFCNGHRHAINGECASSGCGNVITGTTYCSTNFITANMIMKKMKLHVPNNSSAGSCTPAASGMVAAGDPHCPRVRVHFFNESFSQHVFDGFGEPLRQHENDAICSVRRMNSNAPVR